MFSLSMESVEGSVSSSVEMSDASNNRMIAVKSYTGTQLSKLRQASIKKK